MIGVADHFAKNIRPLESLTWKHGVLFGFAQALALIPGVSRSGATIAAGLAMGYKREAAAKYAFLLAIPAVVGSGFFKLFDISSDPVRAGLGTDPAGHRGRVRGRSGGHPLAAEVHQHPHLPAVRDLPARPGRAGGDPVADRGAAAAADRR